MHSATVYSLLQYYLTDIRSDRKFSFSSSGDPSSSDPNEMMKVRRENILAEMTATEAKYVQDLDEVLMHYRDKLAQASLQETRVKAQTIFGNLDQIHEFHAGVLYPELERCGVNPAAVARTFLTNCEELKLLYSDYCQNMDAARRAIQDLGGEQAQGTLLQICQQESGHQLPLSSYLLKPMQRLTKYQLLLKDLTDSSNVVCGKAELEDALEVLLGVIKVVNDSMEEVAIKGMPAAIRPLGAMNCQDVFQVTSEHKGQSQMLFSRTRSQRRQVFVYDHHVVFCKPVTEKANRHAYQFKFSISTAGLGMSTVVKGEDRKIEIWVHGRGEMYVLEAKTKKAKDDFGAQLRKVIIRQKELRQQQQQQNVPKVFYDTASSTTASSESDHHHQYYPVDGRGSLHHVSTAYARLSRSRSLESNRANPPLRSRSLDCAGDRTSSPEEGSSDQDDSGIRRFVALANYMALTNREVDLTEDDVVELVKVGCAGWWYVRIASYPYQEGWAPSTYLEKINSN